MRCFRVDTTPPVTQIQNPAQGSNDIAPIATISGTASDTGGAARARPSSRSAWTAAGSPNLAQCLTGLTSGDTFTGPAKFFELSGLPWSLNTSAVTAWSNGATYHVLARSSDTVQNLETYNVSPAVNSSHITFTVVGSGATGTIPTPSNANATYPFYEPSTLPTISGTETGGNQFFQVQINETDTGLFYNGSGWIAISTWVPTPTPGTIASGAWGYTIPTAQWRVNHNYTVNVRSVDSTGNSPQNFATQTFVIDSTAPTVAVTNPSLAYHRAGQLPTLSANVSDSPPLTAPGQANSLDQSSIYFRVVRNKDAKEWSVPLSTFVTPAGTNLGATAGGGALFTYTTTYLATNAMFEDGYQYKVSAFAADKAGNAANNSSPIFLWDVSVPTAAMTVPVPGVIMNTLTTISGTASDPNPKLGDGNSSPSGIALVEVLIQKQSNAFYFNGTNFGNALPTWLPATSFESALGVATFTYTSANLNASLISGLYSISVRATDRAGNVQNAFAASGSSFTFEADVDPPTISITQPNQPVYAPAIGGRPCRASRTIR